MRFASLFFLFVITINVNAQPFQGKITYETKYKSKIANMSDQQLAAMLGTRQDYFIREGQYKSVSNGSILQWQLYAPEENRLYNKTQTSDVLLWNDVTLHSDEVISAQIHRNAAEILGRSCDELVLTCKSGVQKYYFTKEFAVDPKHFENHRYGNWNEVIARTNAIPLRMIIESPQFTFESTAMEVVSMELDEKLFELPKNAKTEKSPY